MIFWLRFALRSVLRRRRRTLVTFISVALGVAMLIVLGAIMVGVNDTMVQNAVALHNGNLLVESPPLPNRQAVAEVARWEQKPLPEVENLLPRLTFAAVLKHDHHTSPVQLFLVDPQREAERSPVSAKLTTGAWLKESEGFILGTKLAQDLHINVGESLQLITAQGQQQLTVSGIFQTGVQLLDQGVGYLPLSAAADLDPAIPLQLKTALFTRPGTDLTRLADTLQQGATAGIRITPWQKQLPEVEQLLELNKFSMQIMILLVIAILAFGVTNSLLISVMDRYRYYGILKALGARPGEVAITVLGEAVIICFSAGLLGTLLGVLISLIWSGIGLDISHYTSYNPLFSINSVIHPRLEPVMVLLPQSLALLGGVAASIWPALVAARRTISSSMRDL